MKLKKILNEDFLDIIEMNSGLSKVQYTLYKTPKSKEINDCLVRDTTRGIFINNILYIAKKEIIKEKERKKVAATHPDILRALYKKGVVKNNELAGTYHKKTDDLLALELKPGTKDWYISESYYFNDSGQPIEQEKERKKIFNNIKEKWKDKFNGNIIFGSIE